MNKLANKVAVVTGASKGTGIAKGLSGGSGGGRELLLEQGFGLDYGRDASGFGRDAVTKLDGREESLQRLTSAGFVWWSGLMKRATVWRLRRFPGRRRRCLW